MLIFRLEKEHQANYSIEGSIKESRLLNRFAKDGRTRQVVLECRDKGWCCIYPEDLKSFFDQYYSDRKAGPQPRSMTLLPGGSVLAHFRTSFTPIAVDGVLLLPRCARNSAETAPYPLDRSIS